MKIITSSVVISFSLLLCCCGNKSRLKEIQRDNAVINCQVSGSGDTTLLFVHGSYIDQTYWKKQVDYFNARYKVVTFDLPGHGKSGRERTDWSVKGFADDVIEVIKGLQLKNVILIGHSLGGDINLIAATSHPETIIGFIGVDNFKNAGTALPSQSPEEALNFQESLIADFPNTNEKFVRMALVTNKTPSSIVSRVIKDYRDAYRPMAIETTPEMFEMYAIEKRLLPQLSLTLYLINVDYMPTREAHLKKYATHGYRLFRMRGTCHFPMLENPDRLNKLLEEVVFKIGSEE